MSTTDYKAFWNTLFDPGDWTCFASQPHGTSLHPVASEIYDSEVYFTINAIKPDQYRADAHVEKHRTFLFEWDNEPLEKQKEFLWQFPMPVAGMVFSGSKSIHYFVTLEEPVTAEQYTDIWKRIAAKLPPGVDKSTKNPSRLARTPGAFRHMKGGAGGGSNHVLQTLLHVGNRTSIKLVNDYCPPLIDQQVKKDEPPQVGTTVFQRIALLEAKEHPEVVMQNLGLAGRNALFFWLGNRMRDDNMPKAAQVRYIEAVYAALRDKKDFTWNEAKAAARI